jgi:tetratricopeptide (TPR) repeat protein
LLQLGRVLAALEDYDEAIPYFEKARDQANDWGTMQEVGNITRELAEAERDGDYLSRSLQTYEDGLELLTDEFPADRAAILRSYGQALAQSQQFEQARHSWNEALTMAEGLSPLEIALTHHAIGQAFKAQNDYPEAAEAFREALDHHPKGTIEAAATYRDLGETLLSAGDPDAARQPLQSALEIEKALPQQSNARLVKSLELLGGAEELREDRPRAITHYHAALVYMDRGFQPLRYAGMLRKLGQLYAQGEQWEDCQKALAEALDIELSLESRSEERIAATLRTSADAFLKEGHLEKAASAYKRMASYANLSTEDAGKLRSTLNDIERHKATLVAALDSLMVMEKTGSEPKDFAFVYALIVRMYFLLSEMDQSRNMMGKLVKYLNERADQFSVEDERSDYRSLAHLRLAMLSEQQSDIPRARDHYRMALRDNNDSAIEWLIQQSMSAVG